MQDVNEGQLRPQKQPLDRECQWLVLAVRIDSVICIRAVGFLTFSAHCRHRFFLGLVFGVCK